jgi:hypothetical protein
MEDWYKNPIFLVVGGVGIFAAFILLRNQNGSNTTPPVSSLGDSAATSPLDPSQTAMNPVGGSYSYLDGSGMQHIVATDPYGNLVGYSNLPPSTSMPQTNQLSSYVGSMGGQYLVTPYGGTTPSYSMAPFG